MTAETRWTASWTMELRSRMQVKNGLLTTDVDREASLDMLTAAGTTLAVSAWESELAIVTENGSVALGQAAEPQSNSGIKDVHRSWEMWFPLLVKRP